MIQTHIAAITMPQKNGKFVALADVQKLFAKILDDASPCTTACYSMVADSVLREVAEELGMQWEN